MRLLAICFFLTTTALAARDPEGLRLRASIFGGGYTPDLQEKYANDRLYGSFVAGGIGANAPWNNKNASGLPLEAEYSTHPFHFELEIASIHSRPDYAGVSAVSLTSSTIRYVVQQYDTTNVELSRFTPVLLARYDLTSQDSAHEISILGGIRRVDTRATYDYKYAQRFTISQSGLSVSGSVYGQSFDFRSRGVGTGLIFGGDYRYHLENGSNFKLRLALFSADGSWFQNRETADVNTGGSGSGLIRREDGGYHVNGVEFIAGYFHSVSENIRIFAQLRTETSAIRDNKVRLTRISQPTATEFQNLLIDSALTYPGSHAKDTMGGLQAGVEVIL